MKTQGPQVRQRAPPCHADVTKGTSLGLQQRILAGIIADEKLF